MELFYGVYQRDADKCLDALITMGVLVGGGCGYIWEEIYLGGDGVLYEENGREREREHSSIAVTGPVLAAMLTASNHTRTHRLDTHASPPQHHPLQPHPPITHQQVPTGDRLAVRRTAQFFLNAFTERLEQQKKERQEKVRTTHLIITYTS